NTIAAATLLTVAMLGQAALDEIEHLFDTVSPMAFNNPAMSWSALHRRLTDRPANANGGDSPAWSNHRGPYLPPNDVDRRRSATPYAELHCHSNFSFLDGASPPEELAEEAVR